MSATDPDLYALFEKACKLGARERGQFLADLESSDPRVVAELHALLAADEGAGALPTSASRATPPIDSPVFLQGAGVDFERVREELSELTRQQGFDRYERGDELGRGAMGSVQRAVDRPLKRTLAMKTILGSRDELDEIRLGRFLTEARILGRLDHPGIVPIHELSIDREQRLFFTMPLLEGGDLHEAFTKARSEEEGWSVMRLVGVLQRVCEAMAHAHKQGVVHRDLKPSNIMVGKLGQVQIVDWGVARILSEPDGRELSPVAVRDSSVDDSASPVQTLDGTVIGTPYYMPPEQALGRVDQIDERSDIYAVGAMLYELLSGRRPYEESDQDCSPHAVLLRLRAGALVPVTLDSRQAPPELVAVCAKAMQTDASQRYPGMEEFAVDLAAFLEGRVVRAYRTGALIELSKWIGRNRLAAVALAGGVVAVLAGALTVAAIERNNAERESDLAHQLATEKGAVVEALAAERQALGVAEAERERASSERDKVLRLSDARRLEQLLGEMEELWPAHPELLTAMDDWLVTADAIDEKRVAHLTTLAELRQRGQPLPHAEDSRLEQLRVRLSTLAAGEAAAAGQTGARRTRR